MTKWTKKDAAALQRIDDKVDAGTATRKDVLRGFDLNRKKKAAAAADFGRYAAATESLLAAQYKDRGRAPTQDELRETAHSTWAAWPALGWGDINAFCRRYEEQVGVTMFLTS